jgi:tRNA/rRNA methyltransferase
MSAMPAPVVVLVRPQLPENIGMAARAMLNCGLTELRLVRPDPEMPHPKAIAAATHADFVVREARLFDDVAGAVADLHAVYATCPRHREMVKPLLTARAAAAALRARAASGERCGLLFGPERTGLETAEMGLADAQVAIPLNPGHVSLNLAQAVLVVGYEWWTAGDATPAETLVVNRAEPASKAELETYLARLEAALEECGFLRDPAMRPTMTRNIRAIYARAGLMSHEIRTLQGILTGLTERPHASPVPGSRRPASGPRGTPRSRPRGREG